MDMGQHAIQELPEPKQLYQVLVPGLEDRARLCPEIVTYEQISTGEVPQDDAINSFQQLPLSEQEKIYTINSNPFACLTQTCNFNKINAEKLPNLSGWKPLMKYSFTFQCHFKFRMASQCAQCQISFESFRSNPRICILLLVELDHKLHLICS